MPELIILGSSNAVPDETHENTHMALQGQAHLVLIDCVGNPMVRLKQAGIDFQKITDLILTHFHPDHVSGVPSLLMASWLQGRKTPLRICGLAATLDRIEKLMEFYDWLNWPNFFPITFERIPEAELTLVLENDEFRITASPVRHLVPTIGLRIELCDTKKVLAYSCDTEPCSEVVRLASGADILIHEASGKGVGHSSAQQAGEIARQAEVNHLYLIHYPTAGFDYQKLAPEAQNEFNGKVTLAEDFMHIEL